MWRRNTTGTSMGAREVSKTLYVDTGPFIALIWRRDRAHARVAEHFRRVRRRGDRLVTAEPVIAETATRLRYDAGLRSAMAFRAILDDAVAAGGLQIREGDSTLRQAAFDMMSRYADLRLSFADCVGAAVAREVGADAVFGLDEDFRAMGFVLEP